MLMLWVWSRKFTQKMRTMKKFYIVSRENQRKDLVELVLDKHAAIENSRPLHGSLLPYASSSSKPVSMVSWFIPIQFSHKWQKKVLFPSPLNKGHIWSDALTGPELSYHQSLYPISEEKLCFSGDKLLWEYASSWQEFSKCWIWVFQLLFAYAHLLRPFNFLKVQSLGCMPLKLPSTLH